MLSPDSGKPHKSYLWAYAPSKFSALRAVVYDFRATRSGEHARQFLGDWRGKLVCDDFVGYDASFRLDVTEIGCMAHARRKFFELHERHQSEVAGQALCYIASLYEIERGKEPAERLQARQERAGPLLTAYHAWLTEQRH